MKQLLRTILTGLPGGVTLIETLGRQSLQKIFAGYYETNNWGNTESVSGSHSTLQYTEKLRKELPGLLHSLGVRRILDAPCGDYNWFRLVPRQPDVTYIGADIVDALVVRNQRMFGDATTSFKRLDITRERLPQADVWICRDCLFHFSDRNIWRALRNFARSDIKYLLTTTFPEATKNTNILSGHFRLLNLQRPPFNLPVPLAALDDWADGHTTKALALWERDALRVHLGGSASRASS